MRVSKEQFNQTIINEEDPELREEQALRFRNALQSGLEEEGIARESSLDIAVILLALKRYKQTLTDEEINTIIDYLIDCLKYGSVNLKDLDPWLTNKNHLIAYIKTTKALQDRPWPQAGRLTSAVNVIATENLPEVEPGEAQLDSVEDSESDEGNEAAANVGAASRDEPTLHFRNELQLGLEEEGIAPESSLDIDVILLALKRYKQTLTEEEINTIIDYLKDGSVNLRDLGPWLTNKKHLIAYINTLKDLQARPWLQADRLAGVVNASSVDNSPEVEPGEAQLDSAEDSDSFGWVTCFSEDSETDEDDDAPVDDAGPDLSQGQALLMDRSGPAAQAENQLMPAAAVSTMPSAADLSVSLKLFGPLQKSVSSGSLARLDDIKKLSDWYRIQILKQRDHNGCNVLMNAIFSYPERVPSVIELINKLPKNDQDAILRQVTIKTKANLLMLAAQQNPAVINELTKLIDALEDYALKLDLFKAQSTAGCNPLMYLLVKCNDVCNELLSPEPVVLFLESMKTFSPADIKAILELKLTNKRDALEYLLRYRKSFAVPILAKMIEVLPGYEVTIADRLTANNFAIKELQLNKPGALSAFVNLLMQLDKIPAYKKSDWVKLIKQAKDPSIELALLTLLLKHSVMGLDAYLSIAGKHQSMEAFVALWQANERALKQEVIKAPLRDELLRRLLEDKPYARDALIAYLEISQPIAVEDCRVARMQECQEKYKNIDNRAHIFYAFYLENEHTAGVFKCLELLLEKLIAKKNAHPEDLMALALILNKKAEKYGVQKDSLDDGEEKASALLQESMLREEVKTCLQRIIDGAYPPKQRFYIAKPDPICQAIIYGTPLTAKEDPRAVLSFLLAFGTDIRKISPARYEISASEAKVATAQDEKSDEYYEQGGVFAL